MSPTGPLLILSPHLDDAMLSCWALLDRDEPVEVLNVFAGSPDPPMRGQWVELTGFQDSQESMVARRAEDERAFAGTPHRCRYLDLFDGEFLSEPRSGEDRLAIVREIEAWAHRNGRGTVAAPAVAGRRGRSAWSRIRPPREPIHFHPDHETVRGAAIAAWSGLGDIGLVLYEEFPYCLDVPADREVRALPYELVPSEIPVDRPVKAGRIAAYESQLPHLLPGEALPSDPQTLPKVERYWSAGSRDGA